MSRLRGVAALAIVLGGQGVAGDAADPLSGRIRRVVLHVLGGPSYRAPERRFTFFEPKLTQARWKPRFGAHWIVWTDGSIWPRHTPPTGPPFWIPDPDRAADAALRGRIAKEATPIYSHLYDGNSHSLGIEVAHSGRRRDPFPPEQIRSLAWFLRTLLEMSQGRLTPSSIVGHKDLDRRPAYIASRCERPGCPVFVDPEGRPYRRRVDPPEALFACLKREGLDIPRPPDADAELVRAESVPASGPPWRRTHRLDGAGRRPGVLLLRGPDGERAVVAAPGHRRAARHDGGLVPARRRRPVNRRGEGGVGSAMADARRNPAIAVFLLGLVSRGLETGRSGRRPMISDDRWTGRDHRSAAGSCSWSV